MTKSKFFIAAALMVSALSANAGMLTLNGFEHSGAPSGTMFVGPAAVSAGVGGIDATYSDTSTPSPSDPGFIAYCVELFTRSGSFGSTHPYNASVLTDGSLSKLFSLSNSLNTNSNLDAGQTLDATKSAGLQLAVWELLYDGTPGNVTSGQFQAMGVGAGATNWANSLLAGFGSADGSGYVITKYSDIAYESKGYQDFISVSRTSGFDNQVPEPGALALVGLALAGLAMTRRKTA